MIFERKYLMNPERVGSNIELDVLSSKLPLADFRLDRVIRVTSSTARRPDLVSRSAYGNPNYGWLIMDFNNILDPYEEMVEGLELRIPRLDDYFEFYNENSSISLRRLNE